MLRRAKWSGATRIPGYTGDPKSFSGTSPAIAPDFIVIGVRDNIHGATIYALSKTDGGIVWQTTLDPVPALIKSSPVISSKHIFVGVSSNEETLAPQPGYQMKFRGSVQALDFTGNILWRFDTTPAGYTGAAVSGSTLVADTKRHTVYASTGNNYTVPPAAQTCLQAAVTRRQQRACLDPNDYEDLVLAIDANTGTLKRAKASSASTPATTAGSPPPPNSTPCPDPQGPDYDFGSAPNLFTVAIGGTPTDLLGIGQKSGVYRALNPDTGVLVWSQKVGPGGPDGGIEWGSATDGQRVYVAIDNSTKHVPFDIGPPADLTNWTGGAWAALDAATGAFLWQVPVAGQNLVYPQYPAGGSGAMTIANGVVFAPSMSGAMAALEAASGRHSVELRVRHLGRCRPVHRQRHGLLGLRQQRIEEWRHSRQHAIRLRSVAAAAHLGLRDYGDLGRVEEGRGGVEAWPMAPFPFPAHQTGRADLPHLAFRQTSQQAHGDDIVRRLRLAVELVRLALIVVGVCRLAPIT